MTAPLLEVRGLTVALPAAGERGDAIRDVNLTLHQGEILCIVGESGSGKSVTANAIMGLLPPGRLKVRAGSVLFHGADLLRLPPGAMRDLRGKRIAMIFQEPMTSLNPVLTIGRQLSEVMEAHGVPPGEHRARALSLLESVGLPNPPELLHRYPFRLSGGQRQRVMIAMALALEPEILIADEPTTALDVTTQAQILQLIHDLQRKRGMGVLFITHDFGVVADIADRVIVMRKGEMVEEGQADQVLRAPQHPYTQALIAAVPRFREVPAAPVTDAPLLEVAHVRKVYRSRGNLFAPARGVVAVDDVSFAIAPGETLGLVGESGSGKSTIGQCVMRLTPVDSGVIRFRGTDIAHATGAALRDYRASAQIIFQDPFASLNPRRTVGQSIMTGPLAQGIIPAVAKARMNRLLVRVGLDPSAARRFPHEFSGGQRQRIGIARALAVEPQLLVADECVSALDVSIQAEVLDLLREIRSEIQLAMLFITHDLRVASQICDRVIVLHRGRVVEEGEVTQVFGNPQADYTRRLVDAVPGRHWHKSA